MPAASLGYLVAPMGPMRRVDVLFARRADGYGGRSAKDGRRDCGSMALWKSTFVKVLAVELALYLVFSSVPLGGALKAELMQKYNSLEAGIRLYSVPQTFAFIVGHNAGIAATEAIPAFGLLVLGGSSASTAMVINAVSAQHSLPGLLLLLLLFLLPHTLVEILAYTAAATGNLLFVAMLLDKRLVSGAKVLVASLAVSFSLLLFAGALETVELGLATVQPLLPYALWVPVFLVAAGAYMALSPRGRTFLGYASPHGDAGI